MLGRRSPGFQPLLHPVGDCGSFRFVWAHRARGAIWGDDLLAIEIFGQLTGASRDFGKMAVNSVKLASADFEKAHGCKIGIEPAKRCSTITHCATLNLVHAAAAA
jgi:hypothetical protein